MRDSQGSLIRPTDKKRCLGFNPGLGGNTGPYRAVKCNKVAGRNAICKRNDFNGCKDSKKMVE